MNIEDLAPELQEKVKACKTPEELVQLAMDEGVELTDEQLTAVSGGDTLWEDTHPDDCAQFEWKICLSY